MVRSTETVTPYLDPSSGKTSSYIGNEECDKDNAVVDNLAGMPSLLYETIAGLNAIEHEKVAAKKVAAQKKEASESLVMLFEETEKDAAVESLPSLLRDTVGELNKEVKQKKKNAKPRKAKAGGRRGKSSSSQVSVEESSLASGSASGSATGSASGSGSASASVSVSVSDHSASPRHSPTHSITSFDAARTTEAVPFYSYEFECINENEELPLAMGYNRNRLTTAVNHSQTTSQINGQELSMQQRSLLDETTRFKEKSQNNQHALSQQDILLQLQLQHQLDQHQRQQHNSGMFEQDVPRLQQLKQLGLTQPELLQLQQNQAASTHQDFLRLRAQLLAKQQLQELLFPSQTLTNHTNPEITREHRKRQALQFLEQQQQQQQQLQQQLLFDRESKRRRVTASLSNSFPEAFQFTQNAATWIVDRIPVMDEGFQKQVEYLSPATIPLCSLCMGHSRFGILVCLCITAVHTIYALLTDFKFEGSTYSFKKWIPPTVHAFMDTILVAIFSLTFLIWPEEMGYYPFWQFVAYASTIPIALAVSLKTTHARKKAKEDKLRLLKAL